jgi:hypothetical protein
LQEVVIEGKSPARKADEAREKQQTKKAREQLFYAMDWADTSPFRLKGYKNSLSHAEVRSWVLPQSYLAEEATSI